MSILIARNFGRPILQINKLFLYILLINALVLNSGVNSQIMCPRECRCGPGPRNFVDCSNKGLKRLPPYIDLAAQEIDLSGNSFAEVPPEINYFANLLFLNLSHNAISNLRKDAFGNLRRLQVLDVSFNMIEFVHPYALTNNFQLVYLNLANNKLEKPPLLPRPIKYVILANFVVNKSRLVQSTTTVKSSSTEESKEVVTKSIEVATDSKEVITTTTTSAVDSELEDQYTYDSNQKSPISEGLATKFFGPRKKRENTWDKKDFQIKHSEILAIIMMICVFACVVLCCCCLQMCASDPRINEVQNARLERLEKLVEEQKQELTLVKQQQPVAAPPSYEQALQILASNNSNSRMGRRS